MQSMVFWGLLMFSLCLTGVRSYLGCASRPFFIGRTLALQATWSNGQAGKLTYPDTFTSNIF